MLQLLTATTTLVLLLLHVSPHHAKPTTRALLSAKGRRRLRCERAEDCDFDTGYCGPRDGLDGYRDGNNDVTGRCQTFNTHIWHNQRRRRRRIQFHKCDYHKFQCSKCHSKWQLVGPNRQDNNHHAVTEYHNTGKPPPQQYVQHCAVCPSGRICDGSPQTLSCPKGMKVTVVDGTNVCDNCLAGQYNEQNDQTSCKVCTQGRRGACIGGLCESYSQDCPECEPGTFTDQTAQTECKGW